MIEPPIKSMEVHETFRTVPRLRLIKDQFGVRKVQVPRRISRGILSQFQLPNRNGAAETKKTKQKEPKEIIETSAID